MKGICFIEPLFNLTVEGIKTQTRRIMTPQPDAIGLSKTNVLFENYNGTPKQRYNKGEILYLKEPYIDDLNIDRIYYKYSPDDVKEVGLWLKMPNKEVKGAKKIWKNKLFMPESAARYFIEILDFGAERLQEITEEDCLKEGIQEYHSSDGEKYFSVGFWGANVYNSAIEAYSSLINEINGEGTWESNPFVFVYDYKLFEK